MLWDSQIGTGIALVQTAAFLYYFAWTMVTPFVDRTHFTQAYFPPREYGLLVPAGMVIIFFTVTFGVAAWHITFSKYPAENVVEAAEAARRRRALG